MKKILQNKDLILYASNINIDYFPTKFVVQNEEMFYKEFYQKITLKGEVRSSSIDMFIADEFHYVSQEMMVEYLSGLKTSYNQSGIN